LIYTNQNRRSTGHALVAAVGWGTSAVAAANAARRAGTYFAVLSSQGVGVAVLVILVAFLPSSLGAIGLTTAIGLVAAGQLGLLGYMTYYRALEYAPVRPG
jgi:drug/metabolite transporter (DMT)-like permease